MKLTLPIATILALRVFLTGPTFGEGLEGCPEPRAIATALEKLQQANWRNVSGDRVEAVWPTHLQITDCESAEGRRNIASQGRIIEGHCECCEAFNFQLTPNQSGPPGERLNGIAIHYSTLRREGSVAAARRLARAMGLPKADLGTIGRGMVNHFQWRNIQQQQVCALDVQFTSRERTWELFLSLGCYPVSR